MTTRKTAALILAAGASNRLGQSKQLVLLGGGTLLERAVHTAREAGCDPVIVVLGAEADRIRAACWLGDAIVVVNEQWAEGMAGSIRAGILALTACAEPSHEEQLTSVRGVVVLTCDQPAVTSGHLRSLAVSGEVTGSEYAGRLGVPGYFPASWFARLGELAGDSGARELLRGARAVPLENGELDIDTPEALAEARRLFV